MMRTKTQALLPSSSKQNLLASALLPPTASRGQCDVTRLMEMGYSVLISTYILSLCQPSHPTLIRPEYKTHQHGFHMEKGYSVLILTYIVSSCQPSFHLDLIPSNPHPTHIHTRSIRMAFRDKRYIRGAEEAHCSWQVISTTINTRKID